MQTDIFYTGEFLVVRLRPLLPGEYPDHGSVVKRRAGENKERTLGMEYRLPLVSIQFFK